MDNDEPKSEEERRVRLTDRILSQPFCTLSRAEARECVDIANVAVEDAISAITAKSKLSPDFATTVVHALQTLRANLPDLIDTALCALADSILRAAVQGKNPAAKADLQERGLMPDQSKCDCPNCTMARAMVDSGEAKLVAEGDGFVILDLGGETIQ